MSPERIAPEKFGFKNSRPTIPSDCYALGMVIYEIVSGNVPFHKDTDLAVFMKVVVEGAHPTRGMMFTTDLWGMLERCWAPGPNDRPSIEDVLRCLEMTTDLLEPPPGADEGTDDDEETDEDDDGWDLATNSSSGNSPDPPTADDRIQLPTLDPRTNVQNNSRTASTTLSNLGGSGSLPIPIPDAGPVGKPAATKVTRGRFKGPIDYDKQCGVINDKGLPCSRSITCKSHSMGAKRGVQGRSKPYDELLREWRRANDPNFVEPVRGSQSWNGRGEGAS